MIKEKECALTLYIERKKRRGKGKLKSFIYQLQQIHKTSKVPDRIGVRGLREGVNTIDYFYCYCNDRFKYFSQDKFLSQF